MLVETLIAALDAGAPVRHVTGATGGLGPLLLAQLRQRLGRPLVVVTAGQKRAQELADGLRLFCEPGADGHSAVALLPVPDNSPYQPITPNRAVTQRRLATLFRLAAGQLQVLVAPVEALCWRTLTQARLLEVSETLKVEDELDRDAFVTRLEARGYVRVPVVEDAGTYGVLGGTLDVWSPVMPGPVRIDLFGEWIEALRLFDPQSQRTVKRLDRLDVSPVREAVLTEAVVERACRELRVRAGEQGVPAQQTRAILAELRAGMSPLGMDGWLPALEEATASPWDYLSSDALVCVEDPGAVSEQLEEVAEAAAALFLEATRQHRVAFEPARLLDLQRPTPALCLHTLGYEDELLGQARLTLDAGHHEGLRQALERRRGEDNAFQPAVDSLRAWRRKGLTCVVLGESAGHVERLRALFGHYGLKALSHDTPGLWAARRAQLAAQGADVNLVVGRLRRGFVYEPLGLCVFGIDDILPHKKRVERRSRATAFAEATLAAFRELGSGDLVVHADYGIGRYRGLLKLHVGDIEGDYLKLEFRDEDVVYVPVHLLDRVQRYSGGDGEPRLNKLGGVGWEKTKTRAKRAAASIAKALIAVEATRKARFRPAYSPRDDYFEEFCAAFPYDETPDQAQAIDDVLGDMDKTQPMDRLVCGDVGYGKTEVAMRAAFRAVLDQKQVCVLVPTTVLSEQHRLSFEERFRGYPVEIRALSRFRTKAEEAAILEELRTGRCDIVIGTHRLLSKDVAFRDLGLMVVDEEHRFGVKHKERIKALKEMVDVLTLTATPIPRTLNMALTGLREMSIIATPPTDRLAVRTLVSRVTDEVITEAIDRELKRGGQVYVVHNQVESIHRLAERVQRLVPRARVLVGHGQMKERDLQQVMLKFMAAEADVLVCTTIIESGLDIPRANTMLIHRADKLGLAQLYQLRGRVGRSDKRAWCYLLIPSPKGLAGLAEKRVAAMKKFTELGSGFHIASMDLELRGAGNLLGAKQSGHVKEVGLDLFSELLADAVHTLQGQVQEVARHVSCEMKVPVAAFLPERWIPDVNLRLFFYKRIASSQTRLALEEAFSDLADRCGRPPEEAQNLFDVTDLKVRAQRLGAKSMSFSPGGLALGLDAVSPLASIEALSALLNRSGARWRLTPGGELVRGVTAKEWANGLQSAREALMELAAYGAKRGLIEEEAA